MGRTSNSICKQCGTHFYKRPLQKAITINDFCSTFCYGKWKTKIKSCGVCGKDFHPQRREQRFCSVSCAASRPRPEKWNGLGKDKTQTLLNRLHIIGWDRKCMIIDCSHSKTIDLHRVISGKQGGTYEQCNLCALCPNHHAEVHRLKSHITKVDLFAFTIAEC